MLAAEPKWFSITVKLLKGPEMVLGYFIFINKSGYSLKLFFLPFHKPSNIELQDARGRAASNLISD